MLRVRRTQSGFPAQGVSFSLSNLPFCYQNFNNSRFSSSTQALEFQFSLQNLSNKIPKLLDQDLRRFSSIERAFDQIEKRSSIAPCRRQVVAVEEKNSAIISFNSEMDWV